MSAGGARRYRQPSSADSMFDRGVRNHLVACRAAAPLFLRQKRGLIIRTTFWDRDRYLSWPRSMASPTSTAA
jgi:hypothetical protein